MSCYRFIMAERAPLTTRCAIAGGGPAGIVLGYLLARSGIDVVVLEKWPDFFRDFRGDTIHPSTMEVLKELGLLDGFLKLPHSEMTRMTFRAGDDEVTIADLGHLKTPCPFIAFVPQWDFLTYMTEQAKRYPGFHIRMETEVTGLIEEDGRVAGITAKDADGDYEIRAELVVGADGRHSTVREEGGFAVDALGVPIDVLWFRIGRSDADDKQSLGYLDGGAGLVMLDRRDYWQCALIIEKGTFDAVKAAGLDVFRARVASLARLPASAVAEVDSWDKVKLLSVTVDHARRWAREGAVLIGDAAHAMSPIGGVGINYAVQDAVAAANILVPAFRGGRPGLATLDRIQARRSKPARRMQKLQVLIQDRVLSPVLRRSGRVRIPWLIRTLARIPVLRRVPARIIGIGFLPEHVDPSLLAGTR
jgi:2-polyprenyl-6-methoxyphenol hydroxylase-like FAD-dependent oxidoreductase